MKSVLFVCVHNAGRSQMAAGWLTHLAGDRVEVRSAGSAPKDSVNPRRRPGHGGGGHRHLGEQPQGADR
jgi:protein-tyrosine-phosphatase